MSHFIPMTAEEKRWQAEGDAHTLSQAKIINGDENRMAAAKQAAEKLAEHEREQAEALEAVANANSKSESKVARFFKQNAVFETD